MIKKISISVLLIVVIISCTPKKQMLQTKWFDNPNGQSELALMMREMYESLALMKFKIENNKKIEHVPSFDKLLSATPTDPSMIADPFSAYGKAWLYHLEAMKSTTKLTQEEKFTTLVQSCISCHEKSCHGPIVRIQKLFIQH